MKIILNRQKAVRVSIGTLELFLERVARKLRFGPHAITVCLVTNARMARWNHAFRGKRGATDVLSFPFGDAHEPGRAVARGRDRRQEEIGFSSTSYLGDIAIAPAVARRNARRYSRTLDDELRVLILHGALHLLGYDHETDQGQMDRLEQSLRRSLELA